MKKYSLSSIEKLEVLEKAIEIFLNLIFYLKNKNLEFNDQYIRWPVEDNALVTKFMNIILLSQMSYEKNPTLLTQHNNDTIYPQERLFVFFCKKA